MHLSMLIFAIMHHHKSVVSLLLYPFYGKSSLIALFSVAICPFLLSLFFLWLTHREADWGTEVPWYFSSAPWPLNPDWLLQYCCREHHKWYQLCFCPMLCPQNSSFALHMSSFLLLFSHILRKSGISSGKGAKTMFINFFSFSVHY